MNKSNLIEIKDPIESDPRLEEIIDHVGSLLANEYFQIMEETDGVQIDENSPSGE